MKKLIPTPPSHAFCVYCLKEVPTRSEFKTETLTIKGINVNCPWIDVYCEECGEPIHVGEIFDFNYQTARNLYRNKVGIKGLHEGPHYKGEKEWYDKA